MCVLNYIKHMGGVDDSDNECTKYASIQKS
jgi:hypothetical protein